jgi:beta-xylosidase
VPLKTTRSRRRLSAAIAVPLLALACWTASGPLRALPGQDFPDPSAIAANGTYYAFATNAGGLNVPARSATSVWSGVPLSWSAPVDAFPAANHPAWIQSCFPFGKNIWGPTVVAFGSLYYLYYSAAVQCDGSLFGEHAIGAAWSTSPLGPYQAIGNEPLHRDPWHRGAIDPEVFVDGDGTGYLIYSTDWGFGPSKVTQRSIEGRRMTTPSTLESVNTPGAFNVLLVANPGNWERGVTEAPSMVKHGTTYYLFYAGGFFDQSYATNFAICSSPLASCARLTGNPWMYDGWEGMNGPGGLDVLPVYVPSSGSTAYAGFFHEREGGVRELMFTVLSPW